MSIVGVYKYLTVTSYIIVDVQLLNIAGLYSELGVILTKVKNKVRFHVCRVSI